MADELTPPIHVWVFPPDRSMPATGRDLRVAIGTPGGPSTNSWKLWVKGHDVYMKCRDNFRELKASLHASGIWRYGFTEEFVRSKPNVLQQGVDRVWKRWQPSAAARMGPIIGFQVVALPQGLYLRANDRQSWPHSVAFVEPPADPGRLTVLSVTIVPGRQAISMSAGSRGAVIAVLSLADDRSAQLVATHEPKGDIETLIENAFHRAMSQIAAPESLPDPFVLLLHGTRGEDIPWVTALQVTRRR